MPVERDSPYANFNFKVTIQRQGAGGGGGEAKGGFAEASGLNYELAYGDYREGTDPKNQVRKIALLSKVGDITLKRGFLASVELWEWAAAARAGKPEGRATVVIELLSEDRSQTGATFKLENARPTKWTLSTFNAKDAAVAMEEITFNHEELSYS
jgi:phage tail-like protein